MFFCCDKTQFDRYQVTFLIKKVTLQQSTTSQKHNFSSQFDVDDFIRSIIMIEIYIFHSSVKWIVKRLTLGELHIVKWGYLSFLLSSLFCNVLSNSINSIENLHRRTFFFFPKCVQLLIFHTMSSTNKVSSSFVSNKLKEIFTNVFIT